MPNLAKRSKSFFLKRRLSVILPSPCNLTGLDDAQVRLPVLEEAFNEAMKIPSSDGGSASSRQHMEYEQFDKFLSSAQTTQVNKVQPIIK